MKFLSDRLIGRAILIVLAITAAQVAASIALLGQIERQTLREDQARRVAELLVVSERVWREGRSADAGAIMTTRFLAVSIAAKPTIAAGTNERRAAGIGRQIRDWEPSLARRPLALDIVSAPGGREDLVGSMGLPGGQWLNFRSRDISSGWPFAFRWGLMSVVSILAGSAIAVFALRLVGEPLRRLTVAVGEIGQGKSVELAETGSPDLRALSRSMNAMQRRIARLISDQATAMEHISHDLRTPLSRVTMAADFIAPDDIKAIVTDSAREMQAMLASLLAYLRAQHLKSELGQHDLAEEVRTVLSAFPGQVSYVGPETAPAAVFAEPLRLALKAVVENAVQYGERAVVSLDQADGRWRVRVEDQGPGLTEEALERVYEPFFRVDAARARNTLGFGLGIPTANRLMQRFWGELRFENLPAGGLRVTILAPSGT
jgi:signal transduction histidine kinase